MDDHACGQGQTLAVICQKIEEIRNDIEDIKQDQKEYLTKCQAADISRAKYPTPDVVNKEIASIVRHETYFKIIWVGLGCAWGLLLLVAGVVINKLFLH
jgi:hypothetical protein